MTKIKKLCVYCGSNYGVSPRYRDAAVELGSLLADHGIELVYGGADVGLMGLLADTFLAAGGKVTGIIPEHLHCKVAHQNLTEIHVVDTMHARKALMMEYSDALLAMPGGLGTFEEILEAVTWQQLNLHCKPCGLLNVDGFYNGLLTFLDTAVTEHFIKPEHRQALLSSEDAAELLFMLQNYQAQASPKLYNSDLV